MTTTPAAVLAARALRDAGVAGLLSTVVLGWRGRREIGRAYAPINAISHWVFGDEALRRNALTARHTGVGTLVHFASSLLWAGVYQGVRMLRERPTAANAIADGAAVATLAAVVDLRLVPQRLTPGFERRLSTPSLWAVYGGFAIGLALCSVVATTRRR